MSTFGPNIAMTLSEKILFDASCLLSSSTSKEAMQAIRSENPYTYEIPGDPVRRRAINIEPDFKVPEGLRSYLNEAGSVSDITELLEEYYDLVNKREFPVDFEEENKEEESLREEIFDVFDNSPVLKFFGYRQGIPDLKRLRDFIRSESVETFSVSEEQGALPPSRINRVVPRYSKAGYREHKYLTQILREEAVFLFTQSTLWSRLRKSIDAISDLGAPKFEIRPSLVDTVNISVDVDIDLILGGDEDGPGQGSDDKGTEGGGDVPNRAKGAIIKVLALKGFLQQTGAGNWISTISPLLISALVQEEFLTDVLSAPVQLVADP